jgi:hypothetical protein
MGVVQRRPVVAAEGFDYADAFEVAISEGDTRSALEMVRAGVEGMPVWLGVIVLFAHRYALRLDLAPLSAPNHLLGWEIVAKDHDAIRLRAAGPLFDGMLVASRSSPSTAMLETFVAYRRPGLARPIWTAVAPIHRAVVPVLLRKAVTPGPR